MASFLDPDLEGIPDELETQVPFMMLNGQQLIHSCSHCSGPSIRAVSGAELAGEAKPTAGAVPRSSAEALS